jgi:CubicO group peptidase (beta-lactamase class C family)
VRRAAGRLHDGHRHDGLDRDAAFGDGRRAWHAHRLAGVAGLLHGRAGSLTSEFRALVDQKKLAGVTTLVSRHGKVVHFDTYGAANAATGEALKPDSIFRIASMTKPIAGVAMMQLWEQGKWKLSDPVSKHIPEFKGLKVKGPNNGAG